MLTDMPYKITNSIIFNITLYFMTNLRREPGAFCELCSPVLAQRIKLISDVVFFLLVNFLLVLAMSMFFRTIASASRTLTQGKYLALWDIRC